MRTPSPSLSAPGGAITRRLVALAGVLTCAGVPGLAPSPAGARDGAPRGSRVPRARRPVGRVGALVRAALLCVVAFTVASVMAPRAQAAPFPAARVLAATPIECNIPGIKQLCDQAQQHPLPSAVTNPIGEIGKQAASGVFDQMSLWVADSAHSVVQGITKWILEDTTPNLTSDWFRSHWSTMVLISLPVALLMLVLGAMKAAVSGDPMMGLKAVMYVPVAFAGTAVAIPILITTLQITDQLTGAVQTTIAPDFGDFSSQVGSALTGSAANHGTSIVGGLFSLLVGSVCLVISGLLVFLLLIVRDAMIYLVAGFIPVVLATMILPGLDKVAKRIVAFLIALILTKFVIVGSLGIAAAALAHDGTAKDPLKGIGVGVTAFIIALWVPTRLIVLLPTGFDRIRLRR